MILYLHALHVGRVQLKNNTLFWLLPDDVHDNQIYWMLHNPDANNGFFLDTINGVVCEQGLNQMEESNKDVQK